MAKALNPLAEAFAAIAAIDRGAPVSPPAPAAASGPPDEDDVFSPLALAATVDASVLEVLVATIVASLSLLPDELAAVPIMASVAAAGQTERRRANERHAQSRTAHVGSISQAKVDGSMVSRRQLSG